MCIRDRVSPNAPYPVPTLFHLVPTVLDHLDPVSYTHLRAHETSLHLVCRLLLEKKRGGDENVIDFFYYFFIFGIDLGQNPYVPFWPILKQFFGPLGPLFGSKMGQN